MTCSARSVDRLAKGTETGNLSINNFVVSIAETPFGGVKQSGYGREGGTEGLGVKRSPRRCRTSSCREAHVLVECEQDRSV